MIHAKPLPKGERPPKDHNSKVEAGPVSAGVLKSFIERIEKLIEERKAIGGDIRDVFSEAKGIGYDVRTMRKLIQVKAMDAADRAEAECLLDTYAHAIGMDTYAGAREPTEEELTERAGRILAEVDRCMDLVDDGELPKIEAIKGLIGCSAGKAHKLRTFVAERLSSKIAVHRENENPAPEEITPEATPAKALPASDIWKGITAPVLEQLAAAEAERAAKEAERARKAAEREAEREKSRRIDADPLDFPPFLKAKREQVPA